MPSLVLPKRFDVQPTGVHVIQCDHRRKGHRLHWGDLLWVKTATGYVLELDPITQQPRQPETPQVFEVGSDGETLRPR